MNNKTKKSLKAQAHHLSPVIITGAQGLTPAIHKEIDIALDAHELIKLRINANVREDRDLMITEILTQHQAELIQKIGHTVSIYREKSDD
jgi:RNA-binding protein